jgi:hypothetical protein
MEDRLCCTACGAQFTSGSPGDATATCEGCGGTLRAERRTGGERRGGRLQRRWDPEPRESDRRQLASGPNR